MPAPQSLLWAGIQALICGPRLQSKLSFAATRLPNAVAQAIMAGVLPPSGTCFGGEKAVCASCSRVKEEKKFKAVIRPFEQYAESGRCLLEQGLVCLGLVTREGCGGICTGVGQPCRGCFGKAKAVYDPGAKMVSCISSTCNQSRGPINPLLTSKKKGWQGVESRQSFFYGRPPGPL